jgi:thioredoxin 1
MVIEINNENFQKEVKNSDKPVVIDFFANWCGPCQMMKPVFEELSKEYEDSVKFVKVDTEKSPVLAEKFEVRGIPLLVFLKNGEEIERIVGFNSKEDLKQKIDGILSDNEL